MPRCSAAAITDFPQCLPVHRIRVDGKDDMKRGTAFARLLRPDDSVHRVDHATHDCEAEPHAVVSGTRGEEGLEDLLEIPGVESMARIGHDDLHDFFHVE